VRCASAGAERRGGVLCAGPAYVVIPQAKRKERSNLRADRQGCWLTRFDANLRLALLRALSLCY
jgi:hypothetical protein